MAEKQNAIADMASLDAAARARGYRSYEHMIYVAKNGLPRPKQDNATWNTGESGGGFMNFLQQLFSDPSQTMRDAFAWHPKNTIQRASDSLAQANRR